MWTEEACMLCILKNLGVFILSPSGDKLSRCFVLCELCQGCPLSELSFLWTRNSVRLNNPGLCNLRRNFLNVWAA